MRDEPREERDDCAVMSFEEVALVDLEALDCSCSTPRGSQPRFEGNPDDKTHLLHPVKSTLILLDSLAELPVLSIPPGPVALGGTIPQRLLDFLQNLGSPLLVPFERPLHFSLQLLLNITPGSQLLGRFLVSQA